MRTDFFSGIRNGFSRFFRNRVLVLGVVLLPLAAVFFVRLFQLQIVRGNDYYENYVNMTRKEVSTSAMRGNIYDRNGVLLAGNKVVYNVTLTDGNYYAKTDGSFNEMILRLVRLLERCGAEIVNTVPVSISEKDEYVFNGSESQVRRLITDIYGRKKIAELQEAGEDPYAYTPEKVMEDLKTVYNFSSKKWKRAEEISAEDALKICNIRYALSATAFTRYISTPVARDVSDTVQAAVQESRIDLRGVNVEASFERVYPNSECFSTILGYVGSITTEEIEERNAQGGDYIAGDLIGKEGIESYYENYLQGRKGKKIIYVNNTGMIMHEETIQEPEQGMDLYLSIDADTTIAAYNVVEQQLAGIVVNHLYEGTDYDPMVAYEKSEYLIPIRDVYFQMINNNILSMKHFSEEDASETEQKMFRKLTNRKEEVRELLTGYLSSKDKRPLNEEDTYMKAYISYFYTALKDGKYLITDNIDLQDAVYLDWKDGNISFPVFLRHALISGWIDLSLWEDQKKYSSIEEGYSYLSEWLLSETAISFGSFDKLVYDELIHTDRISGCEVAVALMEQGILKKDETSYQKLLSGSNRTAFSFFEARITSMELSPSQIALDPCSAGLVLTDPNNGSLLAVISYPGYDSNRINNSEYYAKVLQDQSSPLYSRATQSRLAPGSTFKMVTATAALEGGYLMPQEEITCAGIFDKLDHPRCWIYRLQDGQHGAINVKMALGQSCNCFFYELGYRFSTNSNGQYSPSLGVSVIGEYASKYGFGSLTGIETNENVSVLTTELPVTSAIGQGTHAFTTISLARYVTAIASSGNVYDFKLLNRVTDRSGNDIIVHSPVVTNHLEFSDTTWNLIHEGMYTVVHEGGSRNGDFALLRRDYAAKSGSAQENRMRAEHGWYVTYGPYDDIQYAMAVQIPNGYSSGNAALIAKGLYEYLEGDITLEEILENSARSETINDILD